MIKQRRTFRIRYSFIFTIKILLPWRATCIHFYKLHPTVEPPNPVTYLSITPIISSLSVHPVGGVRRKTYFVVRFHHGRKSVVIVYIPGVNLSFLIPEILLPVTVLLLLIDRVSDRYPCGVGRRIRRRGVFVDRRQTTRWGRTEILKEGIRLTSLI